MSCAPLVASAAPASGTEQQPYLMADGQLHCPSLVAPRPSLASGSGTSCQPTPNSPPASPSFLTQAVKRLPRSPRDPKSSPKRARVGAGPEAEDVDDNSSNEPETQGLGPGALRVIQEDLARLQAMQEGEPGAGGNATVFSPVFHLHRHPHLQHRSDAHDASHQHHLHLLAAQHAALQHGMATGVWGAHAADQNPFAFNHQQHHDEQRFGMDMAVAAAAQREASGMQYEHPAALYNWPDALSPTSPHHHGASAAQQAALAQQQQQQAQAEAAAAAAAAAAAQQASAPEEAADEELEYMDFDPLLFIKMLPPLEQVVPASRPLLLPPKPLGCRRKTLVLDLDETLVHSCLEPVNDADFTFPVHFNGQEHVIHVRQRPHLADFMRRAAALYEIVVFTASQKVYAEKLLNILDPDHSLISHRIYRESCVVVEGNYLKDLSVLGRDLATTLIVDNSPQAFGFQVDNGVPIESWYDDPSDCELLRLLPMLEELAGERAADVRPALRQRFRLQEMIDRVSPM